MVNYKPDLSCQSKFIPIDFEQQIVLSTFEYALSHIVDNKLDLTRFDACMTMINVAQPLIHQPLC